MNSTACIESLQVGRPQTVAPVADETNAAKAWMTGFGKQPTVEPVYLFATNLDGDQQADLKHHGGPDKAVCVYPAKHYEYWQTQLQPNFPGESTSAGGAFGENLTITPWTEHEVCIGDIWQLGAAVVQVTQPRQPCWKLARWWNVKDLAAQVQQTGFTGWYLRVLTAGYIRQGQQIQLRDRSHPEWTIAAANRVMHHDRHNRAAAESLNAVPVLSQSWQTTLQRRLARRSVESTETRLQGPS